MSYRKKSANRHRVDTYTSPTLCIFEFRKILTKLGDYFPVNNLPLALHNGNIRSCEVGIELLYIIRINFRLQRLKRV